MHVYRAGSLLREQVGLRFRMEGVGFRVDR